MRASCAAVPRTAARCDVARRHAERRSRRRVCPGWEGRGLGDVGGPRSRGGARGPTGVCCSTCWRCAGPGSVSCRRVGRVGLMLTRLRHQSVSQSSKRGALVSTSGLLHVQTSPRPAPPSRTTCQRNRLDGSAPRGSSVTRLLELCTYPAMVDPSLPEFCLADGRSSLLARSRSLLVAPGAVTGVRRCWPRPRSHRGCGRPVRWRSWSGATAQVRLEPGIGGDGRRTAPNRRTGAPGPRGRASDRRPPADRRPPSSPRCVSSRETASPTWRRSTSTVVLRATDTNCPGPGRQARTARKRLLGRRLCCPACRGRGREEADMSSSRASRVSVTSTPPSVAAGAQLRHETSSARQSKRATRWNGVGKGSHEQRVEPRSVEGRFLVRRCGHGARLRIRPPPGATVDEPDHVDAEHLLGHQVQRAAPPRGTWRDTRWSGCTAACRRTGAARMWTGPRQVATPDPERSGADAERRDRARRSTPAGNVRADRSSVWSMCERRVVAGRRDAAREVEAERLGVPTRRDARLHRRLIRSFFSSGSGPPSRRKTPPGHRRRVGPDRRDTPVLLGAEQVAGAASSRSRSATGSRCRATGAASTRPSRSRASSVSWRDGGTKK